MTATRGEGVAEADARAPGGRSGAHQRTQPAHRLGDATEAAVGGTRTVLTEAGTYAMIRRGLLGTTESSSSPHADSRPGAKCSSTTSAFPNIARASSRSAVA